MSRTTKTRTTKTRTARSDRSIVRAPLRIVVLQRGWVVIGRVTQTTPDEVLITGAACARRWGTTAGLGQLAREGKQPNTVLDECPDVRVHPLAIVQQIDCVESSWAGR